MGAGVNIIGGSLSGCCSCPDLFRIFSTLFKLGGCQKKIKDTKFEKKKLRFRGRTETFFTQDLVFVLFCAAIWCYVKSLLLMSRCKIEHSLLVLYIQKNFSTTSKTVYMYVFCLFFSELIVVKIYHVYELGTTTETLFELDVQYLFWLAV